MSSPPTGDSGPTADSRVGSGTMYLLITVLVALLVGLVLVALVQVTFGRPEPVRDPAPGDAGPGEPRFRVTRRGYDITEVEEYLDGLAERTVPDRGSDVSE